MANDDFKKVKISDLDTVLFSASAIPGNEKPIYNVINKQQRTINSFSLRVSTKCKVFYLLACFSINDT